MIMGDDIKTTLADASAPVIAAGLEALEKTEKNAWEVNGSVPEAVSWDDTAWALQFTPADQEALDEEDPDKESDGSLLTARSASLLNAALEILGDEIYDVADELDEGISIKGASYAWRLPPSMTRQSASFVRRFARCFDDLSADLLAGKHPEPCSMAEEIALDMALDDVDRMTQDEPYMVFTSTLGLPEHPADSNLLENGFEELFQDRDFEAYLSGPASETGDMEHLWEEFLNTQSRDPGRSFRRPSMKDHVS